MYCAKCGVNMSTYRGSRVGPKPMIITAVVFGVVFIGWGVSKFASTFSKYEDTMAEQQKTYEDYDRGTVVTTTSDSSTKSAFGAQAKPKSAPLLNLAKKETPKDENTAAALASTSFTGESNEGAAAAPSPTTPAQGSSPAPAESKITNQISVQFYLLSKAAAEKARLTIGGLSSSSVSKATFNELTKDAASQPMGSESHSLILNMPHSFSQMTQEPKTKGFIGIVIEITALKISDTQGDYKVVFKRSLPEVSPAGELNIATAEFLENISIPAGQIVGVSGLLPRKNLLENEDLLYRGNILRAFLDPEFQKFDKEFVVFFAP